MSNTNTNTSNTPTFASSVSTFFQTISNTNFLNYALYNGVGGVPYATFGLVAAVIGVLVYATVTDEIEELKEELTQIVPLEKIATEMNETPEQTERVEENIEQEQAAQEDAEQKRIQDDENEEGEKQQEEEQAKIQEENEEEEKADAETEAKANAGLEEDEEPGERYKVGGKSKKMRYYRRRTQKLSRSNRG
jgi:type IV secretory pathway VirB10-like protein